MLDLEYLQTSAANRREDADMLEHSDYDYYGRLDDWG